MACQHLPSSYQRSITPDDMLLSHISIFSTLSVAFSTAVAQLTPGVVPQFETLFVATLLFRGENDVLEGPFGTRIHAPITGSVSPLVAHVTSRKSLICSSSPNASGSLLDTE